MELEKWKPNIGEKYFLVGGNSYLEYVEENETEYIFMNGTSPWGESKEKIVQMIKEGKLKLVRTKVDKWGRFIRDEGGISK